MNVRREEREGQGFASRRLFLNHAWNGVGAMALAGLVAEESSALARPIDPNHVRPTDQ